MSRVFEALQQLSTRELEEGSREHDSIVEPSNLLTALAGEVAQLDGAPQFSLPAIPASRLFAVCEPHTLAAEKLRGLVARLRQIRARRNAKRILIASAVRGDGKSMMSANLAVTLASQGGRTLLLDGDLHKPTLHQLMGIRERRGITDWCEQGGSIADYVFREQRMPLWFLPAGSAVDQPITNIQSPGTSELLSKLGNWFDWLVIDSPPLVPLADSTVWSTMSDLVVLVVREGATPRKALVKAVDAIDKSKLCAILLNDAMSPESKYYRQYYVGSAGDTEGGDRK